MAGRPRDPQLEQRLLAAAWALLLADGYEALTLTQVAAAAKAHRTDVYRRWATKALLVSDVLAAHLAPVTGTDTGSLQGDLRGYVGELAASWSEPWIDGFVALLGDLRHDPAAELAFRALAEGRGRALRDALERAVARGELRELPPPGLASGLLEGPLMHRRMIAREPLTPDYLDAIALLASRLFTAEVPA